MVQPVEPVQGCGTIALGHGGVIEDVMNKVLDRTAIGQDLLPDVNQLRGSGSNDVDAQQRMRLAVKDHL